MERRKQMKDLERLEDKRFSEVYSQRVELENEMSRNDLKGHQEKQKKILDGQFNAVIKDENGDKKRAAVNNMRLAYERADKVNEDEKRQKAVDKKLEMAETRKILQLQMESKNMQALSSRETDKQFRTFLDQTVSVLGDRDQEEKTKRQKLATDYAKTLKEQMLSEKDRKMRMWNEMGEKERLMNAKGIQAFEAADHNLNAHSLPGFEIDKALDKDDFKRTSKTKNINFGKTGLGASIAAPSILGLTQASPD
jgi:hypothetical protein